MSDGLKNRMGISARTHEFFPVHLLLVDDRHKEIGRNKQQSPAEIGRRYTDDGEGMLVQLNRAADDAGIILEMAVPICIAEHEIRGAIRAMFVGALKETAKIRLNSEHVEVVPSRCKARSDGWIVTRVQADKGKVKRCQIFEAAFAVAQIEIVGIRLEARIAAVHGSV